MITVKAIKQKLKPLNLKQQVFFAWLCGVRALPFLFVYKDFEYWQMVEFQQFLYSILYSLDASSGFYLLNATAEADAGIRAAYAAHAITRAAYDTAYGAAEAVARAVYAGVRAADAATHTAYATDAAAYAATNAARAARAAAVADTFTNHISTQEFENIIINDINLIKKDQLDQLNNDVGIYGNIWDNFQSGLQEIGCGYWADLYAKLFKDRFKANIDEIKLRLTVPESIGALGAADVATYLKGLEKAKRLNEARIIILGEKGAGKTSLATKLIDPDAELPDKYKSTEGVEVRTWKIDGNEVSNAVNIRIWDFAGHVVTHAVHQYFLAERCIYIIVYDGRTESRNNLEKWLDHVEHYGGDSPVYILVNVIGSTSNLIDEHYLYDNYKNLKNIVYISLKDNIGGIVLFRNELENYIRNGPAWDTQVPEAWYSLKERLVIMFSDDKMELIDDAQFRGIMQEIFDYSEYNNEAYIETVKKALSSLGICLWYSEIPNLQAYVLNPNWITYGVYKIVNWLGNNKTYKFYKADMQIIFNNAEDAARYSKRYDFLIDLLLLYKLAYEKYDNAREGADRALVFPSLLSEMQPERNMEGAYPVKDSLLMRFRIIKGIMPIDTLTRFIVQHHTNIMSKNGNQVVWRRGVALNDKKGNEALVIEDGLEIRISVKGKNPLVYLDELRTTMTNIFQSYKSDNPELEYVISNGNIPIYVSDETLRAYFADRREIIDPKTLYKFDPEPVMDKYGIPKMEIINFGKMDIDMSTHNNDRDYADILEALQKFRKSYQAGEMKGKDLDIFDEVIKEASQLDGKKGRVKISDLLSNAANAITIATPIGMYLASNPDIPQKALEWFKTLPIPGIK